MPLHTYFGKTKVPELAIQSKRDVAIPAIKSVFFRYYSDTKCNLLSAILTTIRTRDLVRDDSSLKLQIQDQKNPTIRDISEEWLNVNIYDLNDVERKVFDLKKLLNPTYLKNNKMIYGNALYSLERTSFGEALHTLEKRTLKDSV